MSAFTCGPGSPRTNVLGHSQPSLRDWSRWNCIPRTNVPGYSQPSAVNRISRGGVIIGPDQRVTPREALKAITINAADQYSEKTSKGSIEASKLADLVILSGNPLTVPVDTIKNIKVVETLKEGK
jgi:predicted amidohydrolase YtcJ